MSWQVALTVNGQYIGVCMYRSEQEARAIAVDHKAKDNTNGYELYEGSYLVEWG